MLVAVSLAFGALRVEAPLRPMDSARADLERLAEVNGQPPVGAAQLRVHLRTTPDSAYDAVTRHLIERGYRVRYGGTLALTTGDRYVGGVGMSGLLHRLRDTPAASSRLGIGVKCGEPPIASSDRSDGDVALCEHVAH
ncbi:MAG: hypothetical protein ACK6DP_17620, partial [Gemmatimonas sp.]|uniref:hypothetical protein n=1 Tax=Gemmatimonas sp. TaxID=1962908 RepID=UPI00391EEA8C